jgi:N-sulfoglucosamine sulfohydrolase
MRAFKWIGSIVALAIAAVGILLWTSPGEVAAAGAERNIIVMVTDDQSPDFGAYGNSVLKTPNMDSLAAAGTKFTNAFCTTASCSASRSVILSGLQNHTNGHYGHQHSVSKFSAFDNVVGLPVYMTAAGYRTARCGKYHVAPETVYKFEKVIPGNGRNAYQMANNSRAFIEEKSDKPFFLYFCTADPHRGGGDADELPYKPNRFGNPAPGNKYDGIEEVVYDPAKVIVPPFLPDTPTARAEIAQYYQSVARIDQGLGQLIKVLKETGKWENTVIIYMADHGIAMPAAKTTLYEGGMRAPLLVRDPAAKKRGVVSDAMISWVDITPTVLDFAGAMDNSTGKVKAAVLANVPKNTLRSDPQNNPDFHLGEFHGRSFVPVLEQERTSGWDEVYASHTFHEIQMYYPMRVLRERQYKLIWNIAHPLPFPFASDLWAAPTWQAQFKQGMDAPYGPRTVGSYIHRAEFELFDLEADPWESKNLAGDPRHKATLERMQAKIRAFQERTADRWVRKWTYE